MVAELTHEEMNRVLEYLYAGRSWEDFVKASPEWTPRQLNAARGLWEVTKTWMDSNPSGRPWGTVAE